MFENLFLTNDGKRITESTHVRIHWIILTRFRRRCKARIRRIKIGIWKFNQTAALISAEIFRSFNIPLYDVLKDQVDVEDRVNVSFVAKNTRFRIACRSRDYI